MTTPAADPWFQSLFADRVGGANYGKDTKIYKFEKIKRAKRAALAAHPERPLLDFGIGENDDMAPALVREALKREVDRVENRGYADNGIAAFKEAAASFMQKVFGVKLDPATEVNHAIGSKPAYAMLPAVFINPGDVTLMTVPGYPVAGTHTRYYGGEVFPLPLLPENGYYPDLTGIPADVRRRSKLLVINYPNSPTGATATKDFYKRVIDFALTNQIVVVQDAAHILLSYDGPPLSFLQVDGAREVGVEVHSMSKGFNMIGWRMGFVCGHPKLVQAFADVKDNCDSGQFMAVQQAAAVALQHPELADAIREKYRRRLQKLVAALTKVGFQAKMPSGTYFLYARAPKACKGKAFANAEEASQYLITEQSACCVPWDDAGPFLRFSATYLAKDEAAEDALMAQTVERLGALKLEF
ncbi:MAG: LL-diaminopimelate aminotransferase [Gemmataceae bacterium]